MKTIKLFIFFITLTSLFASCNSDSDVVTLSGFNNSDLVASDDNVVLSKSKDAQVVLSLAWKNCVLSLNNDKMGTSSSQLTTTLQVSASSDFATYKETSETNNSQAYMGADLNSIAKDLGLKADASAPLYFRVKASIGSNIDAKYSETAKVNVTPYEIKMNTLQVLDSKKADTLAVLYSPSMNGEYSGFMSATAWSNCYFQENNGTIWGNYGTDGYAFYLSKESTMWNCWFPGNSGCYYVTMNTSTKLWTAAFLKSLSISGGATAVMTYSMTKNTWTSTFTTTADNANIQVSGTESQYNSTTSTDDSKAVSSTIAFVPGSNNTLTLGSSAGNITVAKAGTYTITINLSTNTTGWTYTVVSGTGNTPTYGDKLYMVSKDDYNTVFTTLQSPTKNGVYNGFYNAAIWDNFRFKAEDGTVYGSGASVSQLEASSSNNIWFDAAGYFLVNADLTSSTWSKTAVNTITATGDFNNWSATSDAFTYNSSTGKWTATCNVNAITYGLYFLINGSDSWNNKLESTGDGTLGYNTGSNIVPSSTGTYLITLDLSNFTYTLTKQ